MYSTAPPCAYMLASARRPWRIGFGGAPKIMSRKKYFDYSSLVLNEKINELHCALCAVRTEPPTIRTLCR